MNIQFWHARRWNFEEEFYIPLKESKLFSEHNFLFPHEIWKTPPNSKETLKNQDIFLCEISSPATWLWIEIWFASLYWVRVICIYKRGVQISGGIKYVTDEIIEYIDSEDMIQKLEKIL